MGGFVPGKKNKRGRSTLRGGSGLMGVKKTMARVSKESIERLNAFIDSLPAEARNKCALCNETLVHLVKTAEVETGAGTATVTRHLADRINEDAAPGDRVSGEALRNKVRQKEQDRNLYGHNDQINKPQPQHDPPVRKEQKEEQQQCTEAYQFETIAISQLRRIRKDDPDRVGALVRVKKWIENQLQGE